MEACRQIAAGVGAAVGMAVAAEVQGLEEAAHALVGWSWTYDHHLVSGGT